MKIVIWLQIQRGGGLNLLNPAIGVLNNLYGEVNVLGAVIDAPTEISINGVRTITKQELKHLDYDMILVAGDHASLVPIIQQADEFGIDIDKTVLDRTVCVPLFTMEKYNKLRRSRLSIISLNCWGGLIYHRLGLPFLTPTVNMVAGTEEQFLKFLQEPIRNLARELVLQRIAWQPAFKINYPIFKVGDTEWWMNHYNDVDVARRKWEERKLKVNWLNALAFMTTENPDNLKEFDKLPFAKKICIVPFQTNIESGFYMNLARYGADKFSGVISALASDTVFNYDIWDMLLYGKKTPLQVVYK